MSAKTILNKNKTKRNKDDNHKKINKIRDFWLKIVGTRKDTSLTSDMTNFSEKPCTDDKFESEAFKACWDSAIKKCKPLKAPGPDGIPAYWWKVFVELGNKMRVALEPIASGQKKPPNWFCQGRVVLLFKKGDPEDPGNYRPISCLNTCYKILTGALTVQLLVHCYKEKILNQEQRALRKGEWACFVSHVMDKVVKQTLMNRKSSYSVIWVDCKKAYDSLSHTYIKEVLGKIGIPLWLYKSITNIMSKWSLCYTLGTAISKKLSVLNGVLQGDVLAPLLFCIGLIPVSHAFNKLIPVIKLKDSEKDEVLSGWLNHLFYMDDLIVYCLTDKVQETIGIIKTCLGAAGLEVNISKCAVLSKDRQCELEMPELEAGMTYKYLGLEDSWDTHENESVSKSLIACNIKMREIWLSDQMSAKQKRIAHNSVIIPKIGYIYATEATAKTAYNISHKRAVEIDQSLVNLLREECIMNRAANSQRIFLAITEGGLGVRSLADHLDIQIIRKALYLKLRPNMKNLSDRLEQIAKTGKRSIYTDYEHVIKKYKLEIVINRGEGIIINEKGYIKLKEACKAISNIIIGHNDQIRRDAWSKKCTGGRILRYKIDTKLSWLWLDTHLNLSSVLTAFAVQENAIQKFRNHPGYARGGSKLCRICEYHGVKYPELEDACHVVSRCPYWLAILYLQRHNNIVRLCANSFLRTYGMTRLHYNETPIGIRVNDDESVKILLDVPYTEQCLKNKPDILILDETDPKNKKAFIVEIGVAWPVSLTQVKMFKTAKYSWNENIEYRALDAVETYEELMQLPKGPNISTVLNLRGYRTKVLAIIVGTQGEVTSSFLDELKSLPIGKDSATRLAAEIQRAAVLGTASVVRATLAYKDLNPIPKKSAR